VDAPEFNDMPFSFADFATWHEAHSRAALQPALEILTRVLNELTSKVEAEFGTGRFRRATGRVKDPLRLWTKMHTPKYAGLIPSVTTIPNVIDDLVGVRVVCTNKSDVRRLGTEIEGLAHLHWDQLSHQFGIGLEEGSERDYLKNPKTSGYRAYHANLIAEVSNIGGSSNVRGELQLRTLLQEGWGELTHEDTYKPDQQVPPLVGVLSKRMGELLATIDDIAEDIQTELGREAQQELSGEEAEGADDVRGLSVSSVSPDIIVAEARRIVDSISRPTSLATIAARLRSTFGRDNMAGWLGQPNFKSFLIEAVPGIQIVPVGPSYVVPATAMPDDSWPQSLVDALQRDGARASDPEMSSENLPHLEG